MKAHIGLDARTGVTHSSTSIAANEHNLNQAAQLLFCDEEFIFADASYRGAKKRHEFKGMTANWHIAEPPGKF